MYKCRILNWQQLDDLLVAVSLQLYIVINDANECEDNDQFLVIIVSDLTRLDKIDF